MDLSQSNKIFPIYILKDRKLSFFGHIVANAPDDQLPVIINGKIKWCKLKDGVSHMDLCSLTTKNPTHRKYLDEAGKPSPHQPDEQVYPIYRIDKDRFILTSGKRIVLEPPPNSIAVINGREIVWYEWNYQFDGLYDQTELGDIHITPYNITIHPDQQHLKQSQFGLLLAPLPSASAQPLAPLQPLAPAQPLAPLQPLAQPLASAPAQPPAPLLYPQNSAAWQPPSPLLYQQLQNAAALQSTAQTYSNQNNLPPPPQGIQRSYQPSYFDEYEIKIDGSLKKTGRKIYATAPYDSVPINTNGTIEWFELKNGTSKLDHTNTDQSLYQQIQYKSSIISINNKYLKYKNKYLKLKLKM